MISKISSVLKKYRVALACACVSFFLWSTSNNTSLIFMALYSSLGISRAQASWPFNLIGPATIFGSIFAGILSLWCSTKLVIIIGLLIYSLSLSLCFLTKDITIISILYGFLKNAGFHVTVTVTPALITGFYLNNRVTIMGMQHAGGALASFVFPYVTQLLLDKYDIHSYFLLMGGIALNGVATALLINNQPSIKHEKEDEQPILHREIHEESFPKEDDQPIVDQEIPNPSINLEGDQTTIKVETRDEERPFLSLDVPQLSISLEDEQPILNRDIPQSSITSEYEQPNLNEDIRQSNISPEHEQPITNQDHNDISIENNIQTMTDSSTIRKGIIGVLLLFKTIFECPLFYLLTLTTTAKGFWSNTYNVLISDFMNDRGVDSSLSVPVLTACGVGQLIGYIGLGWVVDRQFLTFEIFLFILTFLSGISAFLLTAVSHYWMFLVFAIAMGLLEGAIHSVLPIMFRNCLSQESLTFAIGLSSSFAGLILLTREPLIDYFRDTIGSYNDIFVLNGSFLLLISLPWPAVYWYKRRQANRRNDPYFEQF